MVVVLPTLAQHLTLHPVAIQPCCSNNLISVKGTSSRSTKLVHGGVRYLAQGDVSLVLEALHERGLLRQNASHLFKNQSFIIPSYDWWDGPFYALGMKVYDMMAGKLGLGPSESLTPEEVQAAIPNLKSKGLSGGVMYYDGQFDDSRLAINIAQTCAEHGGVPVNYMQVTGLTKDKAGLLTGVKAIDLESGEKYSLHAKTVVNATGVFVDEIIQMDNPQASPLVRPSQGVHIVLEQDFLDGDSAIMIPKTSDGRVLFAVPWHGRVVVGTTDTPLDECSLEPRALEEEIEFILQTATKYLTREPTRKDVLSIFAGLRPLLLLKGVKAKVHNKYRGSTIFRFPCQDLSPSPAENGQPTAKWHRTVLIRPPWWAALNRKNAGQKICQSMAGRQTSTIVILSIIMAQTQIFFVTSLQRILSWAEKFMSACPILLLKLSGLPGMKWHEQLRTSLPGGKEHCFLMPGQPLKWLRQWQKFWLMNWEEILPGKMNKSGSLPMLPKAIFLKTKLSFQGCFTCNNRPRHAH